MTEREKAVYLQALGQELVAHENFFWKAGLRWVADGGNMGWFSGICLGPLDLPMAPRDKIDPPKEAWVDLGDAATFGVLMDWVWVEDPDAFLTPLEECYAIDSIHGDDDEGVDITPAAAAAKLLLCIWAEGKKWVFMRRDDNNNEFEISAHDSKRGAELRMEEFVAKHGKPHGQDYWVEEKTP